MPGDPKKDRSRPVAGANASGGESKSSQNTSALTPSQAKRRVPKIQEPADPVLRAIHRVRGTDLTPLEQMALLALGRLLRKGDVKLGAALVAGVLRVSIGTAENILSSLKRAGFITSNGKFSRRNRARATRGLTAKGRRAATGKRSLTNERKDAHQPMSVEPPERSLAGETERSLANVNDLGVRHPTGRSHPLPGTDQCGGEQQQQSTMPIADIMCSQSGVQGRGAEHRKAGGQT